MTIKTKLGTALRCNEIDMVDIVLKEIINYQNDDTVKVSYAPSEDQYYVLIGQRGFWKPIYMGTLQGIRDYIEPNKYALRQRWLHEVRALVELAIAKESRLSRKSA